MTRVQQSDELAFNEIYQRYSQRILRYMYRMLRQDEAKANDFLQDVFLKIVSAPEKFDTSKNFKTWIFTVAANLCKNHFRSNKKAFVDIEKIVEPNSEETPMPEKMDEALFKSHLSRELNELIPQYKEVFVLRYDEGLSLSEIAEVMHCPLGTVKSRLSSAIKLLADKLNHHRTEAINIGLINNKN